jgi:hypothetical protein
LFQLGSNGKPTRAGKKTTPAVTAIIQRPYYSVGNPGVRIAIAKKSRWKIRSSRWLRRWKWEYRHVNGVNLHSAFYQWAMQALTNRYPARTYYNNKHYPIINPGTYKEHIIIVIITNVTHSIKKMDNYNTAPIILQRPFF